jgi:hypothetical protein
MASPSASRPYGAGPAAAGNPGAGAPVLPLTEAEAFVQAEIARARDVLLEGRGVGADPDEVERHTRDHGPYVLPGPAPEAGPANGRRAGLLAGAAGLALGAVSGVVLAVLVRRRSWRVPRSATPSGAPVSG